MDKLLRDIVTISCSTDPSLLNISTLIPILCERLPIKISSVRVFNISWILLLDTLPNLGLVKYLPQFLHSLLLMLSDSSKEVRQKADACLSYFLHKAIEQAEFPSDWLTNCMNILILECQPTTISFCRNEGEDHADKFVLGRLTALTWINELAQVTRFQVFPELIDVALICLEDSDTSIKSKSRELNFNLHGIIGKYSSHCVSGKEDVGVRSFLEVVESHLQSKNPVIRIAAVEWIISLIRTWTNEMSNETQLLLYLSNLTLTLMDESDEVCELSVRALSMIALVDEHRFHLIFEHLFLAFCKDRRLLQQRSRAIILMLVKAIDALRVYKVLSHLIASAEEKYFESATLLVQTLNTLLLTSAELKRMKNELYDSFTEAPETFYFLYKAWCFDPISSVCICIVFRLYELGGELISQL